MLTRCPSCSTHFRVTPDQLKARAGRVRCGECQNVFNALDSLIEEPVLVVAPPSPALPADRAAEAPVADSIMTAASGRPDQAAIPPAPTFLEPGPATNLPADAEATTEAVPEPVAEMLYATADAAATAPPAEVTEADLETPAATEGWNAVLPEAPPPRRWPWVAGSLVAFATLVVQLMLAFRVELAVLQPESRPALDFLCEFAGCEVGLPAKIGLVGIEASDLHPDSEHKGRLALAATLKNRAPFAQQFPHLELTLTDTADQAIARKVLAPADYLPPAVPVTAGMKPNADIMVAIGIDPDGIAASGYRLYLFYP